MRDLHVSGRGGKEARAGWFAGPAQLGWLGWTFSFFFVNKTFFNFCFSKQQQNHPKTFQKNLIKYFLKSLLNIEHFGT